MISSERFPDWINNCHFYKGLAEYPSEEHSILAAAAIDPNTTKERLIKSETKYIHEDINDELATVALIDFFNSCIAPVCNIREDLTFTNYKPQQIGRIGVCTMADKRFASTFHRMDRAVKTGGEVTTKEEGWITYVDDDLQPIAIKKFLGEKSSLSLTPLTIDGRAYPAGSILRISTPHSRLPERSTGIVTPLSKVSRIKFLRLSAFMHPPEERTGLFKYLDANSPFSSYTLDEITKLAQQNIPASKRVGFDNRITRMIKAYASRLARYGSNNP